jgi:hypothetical protein
MASVEGTYPDQSWAHSLPGYFKENVKPCLNEKAFLIPRENVAIPTIVSKSTVGMVNDRGFIDVAPSRANTTRNFITNPSTYVQRLHPHDLTSGTGGIDNLSNLYRFGQPTPFSNALDFADVEYWGSRELAKERMDPLSNGYAAKVLGPNGEQLQTQMRADQQTAAIRERYRQNMYTLAAQRREEIERQYNEENPMEDRQAADERRLTARALAENEVNMGVDDEESAAFGDAEEDPGMEVQSIAPSESGGEAVISRSNNVVDEDAWRTRASTLQMSPPMPTNIGIREIYNQNRNAHEAVSQVFHSYFNRPSSYYSNSYIPNSVGERAPFVQFGSGPSYMNGSSQNRAQQDINERFIDPQMRAFQRHQHISWEQISGDPNADALVAQNANEMTSSNQNRNDGNLMTTQERIQRERAFRPPLNPVTEDSRERTGTAPSLTGSVRSSSVSTGDLSDAPLRIVTAPRKPQTRSQTRQE